MNFRSLKLVLMPFITLVTPSLAIAENIEYLFFELKPRMSYVDGKVEGDVATKAMEIFQRAGLTVSVTGELPAKRVLSLLQSEMKNRCSVGWFKTPAREAMYRYSDVIFTDPNPFILTAKVNKQRFDGYQSFAHLLSDNTQVLGKTRTLSYGQQIDEKLATAATPFYGVKNYQEMFFMLASGRFSYVITDPLEMKAINELAKLTPDDFVRYEFTDIPPGEDRYIVCTKTTPNDVMERINTAIAEFKN